MKNLHIVGNWKMSLNKEDSIALAEKIKSISKKDNFLHKLQNIMKL